MGERQARGAGGIRPAGGGQVGGCGQGGGDAAVGAEEGLVRRGGEAGGQVLYGGWEGGKG